jgi:glucose/arabinose dehydrogenase
MLPRRRKAAGIAQAIAILLSLIIPVSAAVAAPIVPSNFVVEDIAPGAGLVVPTCIVPMPDGRILVGEKQGRVWAIKNGVKDPTPVWQHESEVLDSYDRGLLSVAVDPHYFVNHYVYFLYTVDPDSNDDETNLESFGRLTRYTINFTDSATVIPSSRTILLGVDWPHGPLEATGSHSIGCLQWGADGSLLVSAGDGSDFTTGPDAGGLQPNAFLPGRTDPSEDIGSYRSQYIKSLNGKVLRLNPATGQGYASNPFYDGNLNSVKSKVWAYGFRNPYRFTVRPGTGTTNPSAGNPGAIYLGDVGWNDWEEMDVITTGGFNSGWPCYEGPVQQLEYWPYQPSHLGCDSIGVVPDDPNPAQGPVASWHHRLDYAGTPPGFIGNCSTAGVFYSDTLYPAQYRGKYFHGDYGQSWLRVASMSPTNVMHSARTSTARCASRASRSPATSSTSRSSPDRCDASATPARSAATRRRWQSRPLRPPPGCHP